MLAEETRDIKAWWMWGDIDEGKPILERIETAIGKYKEKYDLMPNVCAVSVGYLDKVGVDSAGEVELMAGTYIQPGYFWLGRRENVSID